MYYTYVSSRIFWHVLITVLSLPGKSARCSLTLCAKRILFDLNKAQETHRSDDVLRRNTQKCLPKLNESCD